MAEPAIAEWIPLDALDEALPPSRPAPWRRIALAAVIFGAGVPIGGGVGLAVNTHSADPAANALSSPVEVRIDADQLSTNLRGDGGEHHATLGLSVEVETLRPEQTTRREVILRDAALTLLADYAEDDLLYPPGRAALRGELAQRLDTLLHPDRLIALHVTELVVHR